MSLTELTKIFSHLQAKCKVNKLHSSLLIYDDEYLEVKIWTKDKREIKTIMDKSIPLQCDSNEIKGMLLSINEAIAKYKELNPIFN